MTYKKPQSLYKELVRYEPEPLAEREAERNHVRGKRVQKELVKLVWEGVL